MNEFLRRKVGIAGANRLYREKVALALWRVRYFRDSETEEYAVIVRPDGGIHSLHHTLEEKAPGAKLSREEAQALAEKYLRDDKKLDLSQWKLVDSSADARPARTDHRFVWEEKQPSAGTGTDAAYVRAEVQVQGDEVSGYRVFLQDSGAVGTRSAEEHAATGAENRVAHRLLRRTRRRRARAVL